MLSNVHVIQTFSFLTHEGITSPVEKLFVSHVTDEVIYTVLIWVFRLLSYRFFGSDLQILRLISSPGWWLRLTTVWRRDTQQENCWTVSDTWYFFFQLLRRRFSAKAEQCSSFCKPTFFNPCPGWIFWQSSTQILRCKQETSIVLDKTPDRGHHKVCPPKLFEHSC